MRVLLAVVSLAAAPSVVVAQILAVAESAPGPVTLPTDMPGIVNYRLAAPDLAAGGVPDEPSLRLLQQKGVRTVIDLRTEREGTAAEKAIVEKLGMRYVHVPVTAETLSFADADAVIAALGEGSTKAALLHCATSNRTGAVWALMQARAGVSPAEAEEAGRTMGMRSSPMTAAVQRILAQPLPAAKKP